jgi:hypothetical protein
LAKIRHACTTEPVPLFEIFGAFAVDVVAGIATQVALVCKDEAHVHGRRQNAGTVPVNFTLVVHSRVNGAVRQFMIAQPVLRDQFGRVAQVQRRSHGALRCRRRVWNVQHPHNCVRSFGFSWNWTDGMRHALDCAAVGLHWIAMIAHMKQLQFKLFHNHV